MNITVTRAELMPDLDTVAPGLVPNPIQLYVGRKSVDVVLGRTPDGRVIIKQAAVPRGSDCGYCPLAAWSIPWNWTPENDYRSRGERDFGETWYRESFVENADGTITIEERCDANYSMYWDGDRNSGCLRRTVLPAWFVRAVKAALAGETVTVCFRRGEEIPDDEWRVWTNPSVRS